MFWFGKVIRNARNNAVYLFDSVLLRLALLNNVRIFSFIVHKHNLELPSCICLTWAF